jgi:putative endonuclease
VNTFKIFYILNTQTLCQPSVNPTPRSRGRVNRYLDCLALFYACEKERKKLYSIRCGCGLAWFMTPPCHGGDRRFESGHPRPSTSSGLLRYLYLMKSWFVYILLCDQKTFYIGRTQDIEKRLVEHQRGYSRFTKKFSDAQLVHQERYEKSREAEKRESQLKRWSVAKKKALITGDKALLQKLSKGRELVDEGPGGHEKS